jgi:hypothetical protein
VVRAPEHRRPGGAPRALERIQRRAAGGGQLCGYIELDVATLEDAVAWAERCPATRYGTVEVRPVMPE